MKRSGSLPSWMTDATRRRWLIGCLLQRWSPPERENEGVAASAGTVGLPDGDAPTIGAAMGSFAAGQPPEPPGIVLPGCAYDAATAADPFTPPANDPAMIAAAHAFAWILRGDEQGSISTYWRSWLERYAKADHAIAWDAGVAATRAVTLLDFSRRHGLPEPRSDTKAALLRHIQVLTHAAGEKQRKRPLHARALLGHALTRLGLDLDIPATADLGLAVLMEEADRLRLSSGMSALESLSHHLELTAALADSWLAARRCARAEADRLNMIVREFLGAIHALCLPGGLPMIGDVVQLYPLDWFSGLLPGADLSRGWTGRLPDDEREDLTRLRETIHAGDLAALGRDGWQRQGVGRWSGLWHMARGGWSRVGALGHHDQGAFELHYGDLPLFVDPGGSAFGVVAAGWGCERAEGHGGLTLDGQSPYPLDHPDYTEPFRVEAAGPAPELLAEHDGISLTMKGFNRLGGPRETKRRWRFDDQSMIQEDLINGTGRYLAARRLVTPLQVSRSGDGLILEGRDMRFALTGDTPFSVKAGEMWPGYGTHRPVSLIEYRSFVNLPWRASLVLKVL